MGQQGPSDDINIDGTFHDTRSRRASAPSLPLRRATHVLPSIVLRSALPTLADSALCGEPLRRSSDILSPLFDALGEKIAEQFVNGRLQCGEAYGADRTAGRTLIGYGQEDLSRQSMPLMKRPSRVIDTRRRGEERRRETPVE